MKQGSDRQCVECHFCLYKRIGGLSLQKFKTKVVTNSLNPVWNQSWQFEMGDPSDRVIVFRVLDKDTTSRNDLLGIGGLSLDLLVLSRDQVTPFEVPLYYKGKVHGTLDVELTALDFEMNVGGGMHSLGSGEDFVETEVDGDDCGDDQSSMASSPSSFSGNNSSSSMNLMMNHALDLSSWSQLSSSRSLKSILSRTITEKDDLKLNSKFQIELVDDVYDSLDTGDILLHSGNGNFSAIIQLMTGCMWSHVSMLIRNPSDEIKRAYNVPLSNNPKDELYVFEAEAKTWDNKQGGGLQLVEFRKWMRDYYERDPRDFMALRRLMISDVERSTKVKQLSPDLTRFILDNTSTKYEQKKSELMKCIIKTNKASGKSSFFCSEVVAECFILMGLLPKNTISNNYSPRDFSSSSSSLSTVLLQGAKFSTETRIKYRP
mgnify:CR=1 FL=1